MPRGAPSDHRESIDSVCFYANISPVFRQVGEEIRSYLIDHPYSRGSQKNATLVVWLAGIAADCFLKEAPKSELDWSAMVVSAFAEGF
jgi:hypothetical protein